MRKAKRGLFHCLALFVKCFTDLYEQCFCFFEVWLVGEVGPLKGEFDGFYFFFSHFKKDIVAKGPACWFLPLCLI